MGVGVCMDVLVCKSGKQMKDQDTMERRMTFQGNNQLLSRLVLRLVFVCAHVSLL